MELLVPYLDRTHSQIGSKIMRLGNTIFSEKEDLCSMPACLDLVSSEFYFDSEIILIRSLTSKGRRTGVKNYMWHENIFCVGHTLVARLRLRLRLKSGILWLGELIFA